MEQTSVGLAHAHPNYTPKCKKKGCIQYKSCISPPTPTTTKQKNKLIPNPRAHFSVPGCT